MTVGCAYCGRTLIVEDDASRVRTTPRHAPQEQEQKVLEPEATLSNWVSSRFELSVIEQKVPNAPPEVFTGFELGEGRFALVSLRGASELEPAFEALKTSLQADADPGLAANLALETVCRKPFSGKLECIILLFEPRHMRVTLYNAGGGDALWWASSEEGRGTMLGHAHAPLERKHLREAGDHFANNKVVPLCADDLVVLASAGFMKGASGSGRVLFDTLSEHLGEEPLRVVTLVKNGFWESQPKPVADVKVAAVRAVLPPLGDASFKPETLRTKRFELSLLHRRDEQLRLLPLHDERHVLVWLGGGATAQQMDLACAAVTALLDRRDYGDNENPRRAGREALAAAGVAGPLAVVQLFDRYQRVKYFRAGWKQPLALGNRGVKNDGMQQFDEGGEASVADGHRLFFPGALQYEGDRPNAEALAEVWPGGKASRLYEAFREHWKTKKTAGALEKLARAAVSDAPGSLSGLLLVTGVSPSP
jgi:hypothetical protein